MRKWRTLWRCGAALLLLTGCQSARPPRPEIKVSVATGVSGGYYHKVCDAMHEVGQKQGLVINCLPSNGSQQNIYSLEQGGAQFALVQSDVAHRAWKGELPFDESHKGVIFLVAPLFTEKVHVLVRPHQYLTSLAQLRRRRVWAGAENSGSRFSANTVLQAAGWETSDLNRIVTSLDTRRALALLRKEPEKAPKPGALVAFIDRLPDQEILIGSLESMGIKKQLLPPLPGRPPCNVLLAPDLSLNNALDLKQLKFQLPGNCCPKQAAALLSLGLKPVNRDSDMVQALDRLRQKKIDALVEPEPLSPDMIRAILQAQHLTVSPLAPDPRVGGRDKLMIFLREGLTPSAAVEMAVQEGPARMKLWWPQHDDALDEVVVRALTPEGLTTNAAAPRLLREINRDISLPMAFDLLRAGELDAVFQTTAAPDSRIGGLVNSTEVRFLGLEWPMVERLDADGSYIETSLQKTAYPVLGEGVYTVGVQTLMLTSLKPDQNQKVETLARFLRDEQDAIQFELQKTDHQWPTALTLIGTPLRGQLKEYVHPAASPFLVMGHLRPVTWLQLSLLASVILIIGIVGLIPHRGRRLCACHINKFLAVLACIAYWTIAAIWLQAVEGDISQDFVSLPAAALSLAQTVLAHFRLPTNPAEATTRDGRLVMGIFSWIGVILVGGLVVPNLNYLWQKGVEPRLEKWRGGKPSTPMPSEAGRSAAA